MLLTALLATSSWASSYSLLLQSETGEESYGIACPDGTATGTPSYSQILDSVQFTAAQIASAQAAADAGTMTLQIGESAYIGETVDGRGCLVHNVFVTAQDLVTGVRGPIVVQELDPVTGLDLGALTNPYTASCGAGTVSGGTRLFELGSGFDVLTVHVRLNATHGAVCVGGGGSVTVQGELSYPLNTKLIW